MKSVILIILTSALSLFAAPSLLITKPSVTPIHQPTGPIWDCYAQHGQWFLDIPTGQPEVRSHEFHDNVHPGWGGGADSWHAIRGVVTSITMNKSYQISSFQIYATITNDTPALSAWEAGDNSHLEFRPFTDMGDQYVGTLYDTKLAIEFAVVDGMPLPISDATYLDPGTPYIIAQEADQKAWYCWCPTNDLGYLPGDFYVPTWDFGDIHPGDGASRTLQFQFSSPLSSTDPRYQIIVQSEELGLDVLANRSSSLKISDWVDAINFDSGVSYPAEPLKSSDCSVFHNLPEPLSFIWGLLALLFLIKRR